MAVSRPFRKGGRDMNLDLDRMLEAVSKGQWSVDDFDWDRPVEGEDRLPANERKLLGKLLLFTAGIERLGADAFRAHANQVSDPRAKAIFELIALDEERHAAAEVRMAKRLGFRWNELPWVTRLAFREVGQDLRYPSPGAQQYIHENISMLILLFELALDTVLIPTIKNRLNGDPVHEEVFRLLDKDESRHLSMDYWLLELKGSAPREKSRGRLWYLRNDPIRLRSLAALLAGFAAMTPVTRKLFTPEQMADYWKRVEAIPKKSPHAGNVPGHRRGVRLFRTLIGMYPGVPPLRPPSMESPVESPVPQPAV